MVPGRFIHAVSRHIPKISLKIVYCILTDQSVYIILTSMTPSAPTAAHQRITDVAFDLFFKQGYRATGINQIIANSGVAKASFYAHFPAKEDLLLLYARHTCDTEIKEIKKSVLSQTTARKRFFALIESLEPWLVSTDYRGCPFQNLLAEISQDNWRIREIAQEHRQNLRNLITPLAKELLSEITPPQQVSVGSLVDTYLLLLEGAVVLTVLGRRPEPCHQAINTLKTMLGLT